MFVYTVYPVTGVRRKQAARRVEPISGIKATTPVESGRAIQYDVAAPLEQIFEPPEITRGQNREPDRYGEIGGFQISRKQSERELPAGEIQMLNMMPLLLSWRRSKTATAPDFIAKRHDALRAMQAGRSHSYKMRKRTYSDRK